MNKSEARQLLDAAKLGDTQATLREITDALIATGDIDVADPEERGYGYMEINRTAVDNLQ